MEVTVGSIFEGKVTGITKFGAFVALPEGGTGMVHISEISHTYVSAIKDHLTEGQIVRVKVIGIDDNNRINLSIKKAMDPPPSQARPSANNVGNRTPRPSAAAAPRKQEPQTFEDKLKLFMQDSDSKMSDLKHYTDRKSGSRRGRR